MRTGGVGPPHRRAEKARGSLEGRAAGSAAGRISGRRDRPPRGSVQGSVRARGPGSDEAGQVQTHHQHHHQRHRAGCILEQRFARTEEDGSDLCEHRRAPARRFCCCFVLIFRGGCKELFKNLGGTLENARREGEEHHAQKAGLRRRRPPSRFAPDARTRSFRAYADQPLPGPSPAPIERELPVIAGHPPRRRGCDRKLHLRLQEALPKPHAQEAGQSAQPGRGDLGDLTQANGESDVAERRGGPEPGGGGDTPC